MDGRASLNRQRLAPRIAAAVIAALLGAAVQPAHAALRAPALASPAPSAKVDALPTFTWGAVRGAAMYEFQLSDDAGFRSIVLGRGAGRGAQQTRNTAATLDKSVPDGNYFWRVRAITASDRVGSWSRPRSLTKAWTPAPVLLGPVEGEQVSWPATPLMLRWSAVSRAAKYIVTIATDPSLAQQVGTLQSRPQEVPGTAYALQGTLPAGRYYWAITPVDAGGLRGTRSRVASFTWTWPTATQTGLLDLNDTPQVFDPLLAWDPVPGAARYEVEINPDDGFAAGSRVCCKELALGTSLSPLRILPNNNDFAGSSGYHWRVRAFDVDGNPGHWNRGAPFEKAYDDVEPPIPGLELRDHAGPLAAGAGTVTGGPVIAWQPVPGAAQYHVQWTTWDGANCGWSNAGAPVKTASNAWTPLSPTHETGVPGGIGITPSLGPNGSEARSGQPFLPETTGTGTRRFDDGVTYCVRVRALSDDSFRENDSATSPVLSQWAQLGGANRPAFTYRAPPPATSDPSPVPQLPAPTYLGPTGGTVTRSPLLRWAPVAGARRYFVVVARDSNFTNVVDAAFTAMPAYAPNLVLEDEVTSYFWAVIPSATSNGSGISGAPRDYNPQRFNKLSDPPVPVQPVAGADISSQPTFRWTPAEGAQKYRLQVSADPQFGDLIDDLVTSSTAHTSSTPYPVDTALYWRVRAEQLQVLRSTRVALRWSAVGSFRRRLPAPVLAADIPLAGQLPPPLRWSPVPGAVSYDMRIEEPDGDTNDFNIRSAAGTFTKLHGIGTFKYRVRANFAARSGVVASAFSPPRDFTRMLAPPASARVTRTASGSRLYLSWEPGLGAAGYRAEVSSSESFSRIVESVRTTGTSWAPAMLGADFKSGRPLYWRVATVDEGGNVGAYADGRVGGGKRLSVLVRGLLRRNATTRLTVTVRGAGRALRRATVRASGAGVRASARRTDGRGRATLRLRPRTRGYVTIRVARSGYAARSVRVRVR